MSNEKKWKCSICGCLYARNNIILNHPLSPICHSCLRGQEELENNISSIISNRIPHDIDFLWEQRQEIKKLQEGEIL